ncbi:MAG: CoA transferase, partial [Burkholderiaceae bacterium]|nr:CoA transferase [Burkholderiaceae bacterium]
RGFEPFAEGPGGAVSGYFMACNRSKRSIPVNMRHAQGQAILRDLAERLPTDVEGIVRRQMSVAIDAAVQRLAAEARLALASSLREIVDRAVRAELERLRGLKK